MRSNGAVHALPAASTSRRRAGFRAVAFAFLIVMAFSTLPSPLYGLYRTRDHLSAFIITVIYAISATGTVAALPRCLPSPRALGAAASCSAR
jgi:hypothetical protein